MSNINRFQPSVIPTTIYNVLKQIKNGQIVNPVLESHIMHETIELILARVPMNKIYCTEDKNGIEHIISGGERILAIRAYYENGFKLHSEFEEINGKSYNELSPFFQNRFEDYNLDICTFFVNVPIEEAERMVKKNLF